MAQELTDHYKVLGVRRKATSEEIRAAYRTRARESHPDVSDAPDAADRFHAVREAYEALSDPIRREQYDALLTYQDLLDKRRAETPPPPRAETRDYFQANPPREPKPEDRQTAAQLAPDVLKLTGLHKNGKYAEAKTLAKSILSRNPTIALAYGVLGDVARHEGELGEAAKQYALAAQYDARGEHYQRLHEMMLDEVQRRQRKATIDRPDDIKSGPLGVAFFVGVSAVTYLVFSQEPAIFASIGGISTWTLGLIGMLFLLGLAVGMSLSLSEVIDTFSSSQPAIAGRPPAAVICTGISLISFWVALLAYLVVGGVRQSYSPSLTRWMVGMAVAALFLAAACLSKSPLMATQTALWGGNVAAVGGLLGWMISDLFRRRSFPSA